MGRPEKLPAAMSGPPRGRESNFARRPFFGPAASLVVGILIGKTLPFPASFIFLSILFLLPFLWIFRGRPFFPPLFLVALVGVGILRMGAAGRTSPNAVSHWAKGDWSSLEGKVASLPEFREKGRKRIVSFLLEASNLVIQREFFEVEGKVQVFLFNPTADPPYGSRIRLRGKLVLPKEARNPGEFDYRSYLAEQGIHAVFEGYGPRSLQVLEIRTPFWRWPATFLQKLRVAGVHRYDSLFSFPDNGLLKALVLGIRRGLPEELRDDFMKTGTSHLIAISGMNITLVAGSLFFLALLLGLPQKAAALVGLLSSVGYVFLSGAGIPVVRAGWMAGLFFAGLLIERQKDLLNSLFFALFVILVVDPRALFQVGFQLSFLSVFSLIVLVPYGLARRTGDWLQNLVVLVGTFPLGAAYFNVFSWVSLMANLLAIPLFHLGVLGGIASLLAGSLPVLGNPLVQTTTFFLEAGLAWIHFWAKQPWACSYLKPPSRWLFLFYYGALAFVWATWRWNRPRRPLRQALAVSCWLLAAACFFLPVRNSNFVLTLFAAGQNELLHIWFPQGGHWLVNAGRGAPSDQARWTLAPHLRREGVRRLKGIVLTDFSRRHTGGLPTLLKNFAVETLLFPAPSKYPAEFPVYSKSASRRRRSFISLYAGDRVPVEETGGFHVLDVIEGQAVLLIYFQDKKILLLPRWKLGMMERLRPTLQRLSAVDGLILPAYGKPTALQWREILSLLLPQWVILSKPNIVYEPLLDSLAQEEIPYFFLSETGALRFETVGGRWLAKPFHKPAN